MTVEISERAFEEAIERALLRGGPEDYDRGLCLLPVDVIDFLLATQPREWKKLTEHYGGEVREGFLARSDAIRESLRRADVGSRFRARNLAHLA